jgi:hypothetical protein
VHDSTPVSAYFDAPVQSLVSLHFATNHVGRSTVICSLTFLRRCSMSMAQPMLSAVGATKIA